MYDGSGLAGMPSMSAKPPGLEKFTHEQILKFAEMLQSGTVPPELSAMLGGGTVDANGRPIIDAEGGAVIQPQKGFVVKTKAPNVGKVFLNMCQHDLIEPFEEKMIPAEDQQKYGAAERGMRFPLSMGERREEHDKKGEACMVIDVIWSPKTVERCLQDASFRQSVIELAFNYVN